MANRNWNQPKGYLEKGVVRLFCTVTLGATGAVSSFSGKGVTSVTRNSAGNYTIVLQDKYVSLLKSNASIRGTASTGTPTAGKAMAAVPFNPVVGNNTNSIQVQCLDAAAAAADATDNWFLEFELAYKDSLV